MVTLSVRHTILRYPPLKNTETLGYGSLKVIEMTLFDTLPKTSY